MTRSPGFWIVLTVFLVVFGLAIFAITRQYYIGGTGPVGDPPNKVAQAESTTSSPSTVQDPDVVSHLANEAFAAKQYDRAADLYEQLLALRPNDVLVHNNLGITLHYLGRSAEALRVLDQGVSMDPTYQRIWLTLGFVNSQVGNIPQARAALTTATELDAGSEVGQSAAEMLASLPPAVPALVGSQ